MLNNYEAYCDTKSVVSIHFPYPLNGRGQSLSQQERPV